MLERADTCIQSALGDKAFDVKIASVATAIPQYKFSQTEAVERAKILFPHLAHLDAVFANTGIESRYSCVPLDWYREDHGWKDRTKTFQKHAVDLMEEAARKAIAAAGLKPENIDAIVTNTITGIAVPSLDAMLMNRMDLPSHCERLPIFGVGCAGGVTGLARATRLAQSIPNGNVLFLTVELCGLCFRKSDTSKTMFVASALFGDGAAGVVLRNMNGMEPGRSGGQIQAIGEHFWRGTEHIMGWTVEQDGFGVVLSTELPGLMSSKLGPALETFLKRHGLSQDDFKGFIIHPGGRKVLETAEAVLGFKNNELRHSWSVLRDFGNMSSSTILFILQRALGEGAKGRQLMAAFGPGFSASFAVVDL